MSRLTPIFILCALCACAGSGTDDGADNNGTNNGANNGPANNGQANNGTNNGANNGANNGPANNGANNGPANNGPANNGPANNGGGVTYHGQIRAVFQTECVTCHSEGGIGPFRLDYDAAQWQAGTPWWAPVAMEAVTSGTMPPWQPADGCRDIEHTRTLSDAQRELLGAWAAAGFPEGNPASYVPPTVDPGAELPPLDLTLDAGVDYAANPNLPDDYRCLLLDHTFTQDTFVTGSMVLPGQRATVHHVLVYRIDASDVAAAVAQDAQEPGPGYTCFGGTGASGGGPVAGWVPGSVASRYPAGSAIVVPSGSRLVMQVHYNTLAVPGDPPADRTRVGLWTLPQGQVPTRQVIIAGFPDASIRIDAGDAHSVHVREFDLPGGARIIGAAPHMHTLGTAIRSELLHDDGQVSCVVDIPDWDFNWQQFYQFEPDAFLTTQPGDKHRLTCVYDNSPANQPVINGEQREPRDVRWGEGTLDEMCLSYLVADYPYVRPPTAQCAEFPSCVDSCAADDTRCYVGCVQGSEPSCASCLVNQTAQCAQGVCTTQLVAVSQCIDGCGGNLYECLVGDCLPAMTDLYTCQRPALLDGTCNAQLAQCGVRF